METPSFIESIVNAIGDISITEALNAIDREFAKMPTPVNPKTLTTKPVTTTRTLDKCEVASETFPSVALATGERLHLFYMDGEWHAWLNTEVSDFDGLCIAIDDTREGVEAKARALATAILSALNQEK